MTKPLVFPETPAAQPVSEKASGPKPLAFSPAPAPVVDKQEKTRGLVFPAVIRPQQAATPVATPAPKAPIKGPGALFQKPMSAIAVTAVAAYKEKYVQDYEANTTEVRNDINELVPLNIPRVLSWGDKALQGVTLYSSRCAHQTNTFAQTRATDVIDNTMKALTPSKGMFDRLFRSHEIDMQLLTLTKNTLAANMSSLTGDLEGAQGALDKLVRKMNMLRVVTETVGKCPDLSLEEAIHERQTLLLQASMQVKIVIQQLNDLRRQYVDLLSRFDQLINVTIPAFESANARR